MNNRDWFRKGRWRESDRSDYFARISRARKGNRAQYLRIQAVHLEEAGEPQAGVDLLEILLAEYPDEAQLAAAYHQMARCLERLGRKEAAESAYRSSLEAMRDFPQVKTHAHLDFAHFAVREERVDIFDEVLTALEEFSEGMMFPAEIFRYASARALILARKGHHTEAELFARRALEATTREESGLRYHPHLGLVSEVERGLHEELKTLAGQS